MLNINCLHLYSYIFIHAVNWVKATGACFCNTCSSLEYGILLQIQVPLMNGMNNRNINFKNIDLIEIVWQIFCKAIKILISRLLNNLIFDNYRYIGKQQQLLKRINVYMFYQDIPTMNVYCILQFNHLIYVYQYSRKSAHLFQK